MAHRSRFDGTHQPGPGLAFVRADKCGEDRAAGAPRDAIYYLQLARQARRLAATYAHTHTPIHPYTHTPSLNLNVTHDINHVPTTSMHPRYQSNTPTTY